MFLLKMLILCKMKKLLKNYGFIIMMLTGVIAGCIVGAIFPMVKDGDTVTVDVAGKRRTRWYDVQVRVHPDFRLEMHVDTDDANAAGIGNGSLVKIVKE